MRRYSIDQVRPCSCGATIFEVTWSVTGERDVFHYGTLPMNLRPEEREELRRLHLSNRAKAS